jgi:putative DNA primase/helicase
LAQLYQRTAERAHAMLRAACPDQHAYLAAKKLGHVLGLVDDTRQLLVPMRTLDGNQLVGLQVIAWLAEQRQWQKKMLYGTPARGAVFRLGSPRAGETWLVEGYATGLTCELALRSLNANASVLVCFSAHNLAHVASQVRGRKFAFADHDKSGTGLDVVKAAGLTHCISPVEGEDANDWYVRAGLFPVAAAMMRLRCAAPP